jgi:hypothetical protein
VSPEVQRTIYCTAIVTTFEVVPPIEIVKLKILRDHRVRQIPVTAIRVEDYLG